MRYAINGSLRKNLQDIVKDKWIVKLLKLQEIIIGLEKIHQQKLVHCDFHHGNILNQEVKLSISDLGLCKPIKYFESTFKKDDIYGVLPFVAPEILRGKPYTPASNIYSFSMIMWEFTSGIPPFDDIEHGFQLSLSICKGKCLKIIENTPQCYIDLMKKCWDEDLLKRPDASEVKKIIDDWISNITKVGKSKLESINEESESENIDEELESENIDEKSESENINKELDSENINENSELENIDEDSKSENNMSYCTQFISINKELESKNIKNIIEEFYKADKFLKQKPTNVSSFKSHPQAYYTSCLLNFTKQLNEILNQEENAKAEYSGMFYF